MNHRPPDILLIEDDPRDMRLTMNELRRNAAHLLIEVARDGEEALDFLFCRGVFSDRLAPNRPRLVLLDLKLPKVDGLEVLREIRRHPETQPIPVVALTSSREEKDRAESYQLGVNSYIQKPVDFEQFRRRIQILTVYWLEMNEPPPESAFSVGTP